MPARQRTRLLLVGAGHTHLHLLSNAQDLHNAGYAVTLLAPREFRYSGVASGSATGGLPIDIGTIDVGALTGDGGPAQGVDHHAGRLVDVDLSGHRALTDGGRWLDFDVLSVNIGSVADRHDIEATDEVWASDVVSVKPLEQLRDLNSRISSEATCAGSTVRVTLIGGGPTAMELAGNLSSEDGGEGAPPRQITVIEASETVMGHLPDLARRRLLALLRRRGVTVITGRSVRRIERGHVVLAGDEVVSGEPGVEHDVVVLASGLVSPPLLAEVGLSDVRLSDHGSAIDGIPVRTTLQHRDYDDVYAVGDCAFFTPQPLAKIGVYGVRQGPVLLASLLARAAGEPLPEFEPQRHALQVLDLGDGVGLATRGRWWWMGRAALRLKRRVDRRWLAQYQ